MYSCAILGDTIEGVHYEMAYCKEFVGKMLTIMVNPRHEMREYKVMDLFGKRCRELHK